ncbi:MAG: ribulose-phosphate 3-epimerase, partial [Chloroflexi bacterium]|nr:ribulose-phosphate 3-epimerase [Chloroflexota bacterium]
MRILPAILTDRADDLEKKIRQAETCTRLVQVDIMDGRFVPSRSINAADLSRVRTTLELELHLMVLEPENQVADFVRGGASRIVFHYEASADPAAVIRTIRAMNVKAGLALNPETPIEPLVQLAPEIDFALFLSVNP